MNWKNRLTALSAAVIVLAGVTSAQGATIVHFDTAPGSGSGAAQNPPWTATNTFDANLRPFGAGSVGLVSEAGLAAGFSAFTYFFSNADAPDSATAFANEDFITFTIQAATGYQLDLNGAAIQADFWRHDASTSQYQVSYYAQIGANAPVLLGTQQHTAGAGIFQILAVNLPNAGFDGVTDAIKFYVTPFDQQPIGTPPNLQAVSLAFNDLQIGGNSASVTLVPEPASAVLMGLGGMLVLAGRRRRLFR